MYYGSSCGASDGIAQKFIGVLSQRLVSTRWKGKEETACSVIISLEITETLPAAVIIKQGQPEVVTLIKDIAGLGFSVEGGKDSPVGDVPLRIKKIFAGNAIFMFPGQPMISCVKYFAAITNVKCL